jgi:hypothetical protein
MLGNRRLVLDSFCEIGDLLRPWANEIFWDFNQLKIIPGSIYVFGRNTFFSHIDAIRQLVLSGEVTVVFSNPHEGSWTMLGQLDRLNMFTLAQEEKYLIVGGGDMQTDIPYLRFDSFLPKVLDYEENIKAQADYHANWSNKRPYKFLFLNGRGRAHRRQLLQRLQPVLDQAIWTNLDSAAGLVQTLPKEYEFDFYRSNTTTDAGYVKYELFNNNWGEIYLAARPYLDTHFSLVTETVFEYPYSFRTEKIAKPLAMAHPFVVVSNQGFYRDLHNLGFKTFGHVVDESFDLIENNDARLERIAQVVEDLCRQDLAKFSEECYNICKYNQHRLAELQHSIRQEFPQRFEQFINERSRD